MGCIYVVTNKTNNKIYVGQTIREDSSNRIKSHIHSDNLLGRAIKKYGLNNFIIKEYLDIRIDWLDWAEIEMIKYCNSLAPNGYNLETGGNENKELSDDTKLKISNSKIGTEAWNKGMPCDEEWKIKNSEAHKGMTTWNKNIPMKKESIEKIRLKKLGKTASEETKSKMRETRKNKPVWNKGKKGLQVAWNKGLPASENAKKALLRAGATPWNKGIPMSDETRNKLKKVLKGRKVWNKGKTGIYSESAREKMRTAKIGKKQSDETREKMRKSARRGKYNHKAVMVICIETKEIFDSISEACKKYKIANGNVSRSCKYNKKTAGGFHWKYYKEEK